MELTPLISRAPSKRCDSLFEAQRVNARVYSVRVDAVVIGAGQAGLAASHELVARGIEHVVLEATGAFGDPNVPALAANLAPGIHSIWDNGDYRSVAADPDRPKADYPFTFLARWAWKISTCDRADARRRRNRLTAGIGSKALKENAGLRPKKSECLRFPQRGCEGA